MDSVKSQAIPVLWQHNYGQEGRPAGQQGEPSAQLRVREDRVVPRLDRRLARVFEPASIEQTPDQLASAQQPRSRDEEMAVALRRQLAEADRQLTKHRVAIEAGG